MDAQTSGPRMDVRMAPMLLPHRVQLSACAVRGAELSKDIKSEKPVLYITKVFDYKIIRENAYGNLTVFCLYFRVKALNKRLKK